MKRSESEKVIRTLYQITTETHNGFEHQINRLLMLGCERFDLNIAMLSRIDIERNQYEIMQSIAPDILPLKDGEIFDYDKTYCALTVSAQEPVGFEHISTSFIKYKDARDYFPVEAYIGTPVFVNSRLYGTLSFSSLTPRHGKFSEIDVDALQLMAAWIGAELLHIEHREQLQRANEQLLALANTDPLTGLNNRRAFQQFFQRFVKHARRVEMPVSIVMIDVDYFKHFNDTYGHIAGDEALKTVAKLLTEHCRESDFVARYGGEEFILMLPNTDESGAKILAENIRQHFHKTSWPNTNVTASFGAATALFEEIKSSTPEKLISDIVDRADKSLYYSKQTGRDKVTVFSDIKR